MKRFHAFLDSLHTSANQDTIFAILEGLWSIYGNDTYSQDMGGELLTEELETNDKSFEERSDGKCDEQADHRLAELDKAAPKETPPVIRLFARV